MRKCLIRGRYSTGAMGFAVVREVFTERGVSGDAAHRKTRKKPHARVFLRVTNNTNKNSPHERTSLAVNCTFISVPSTSPDWVLPKSEAPKFIGQDRNKIRLESPRVYSTSGELSPVDLVKVFNLLPTSVTIKRNPFRAEVRLEHFVFILAALTNTSKILAQPRERAFWTVFRFGNWNDGIIKECTLKHEESNGELGLCQ